MKIVFVVAFVAILGALAAAGVFMLRPGRDGDESEGSKSGRMARALALRVAVSVALFLFILLAWHFGWIVPTGVPVVR